MDLKTEVKLRLLKHEDPRVWFLSNLENESISYGHIDGVIVGLD